MSVSQPEPQPISNLGARGWRLLLGGRGVGRALLQRGDGRVDFADRVAVERADEIAGDMLVAHVVTAVRNALFLRKGSVLARKPASGASNLSALTQAV